MVRFHEIKKLVKFRISKVVDKQFTLDVDASIQFIREECSDEELWWLGEIFDDLMEATRSVELLNSIRERVQCVSNEKWKNNILEDIRTAAEYIDE